MQCLCILVPRPGSIAIDAFTLSWEGLNFYAVPPFILLPRTLRKLMDDKATGTLVVPWWPSQAWFPLFCRLLLSEPLILPPNQSLLSSPFRNQYPAWKTLFLAVAKLSGNLSETASAAIPALLFLYRKLPSSNILTLFAFGGGFAGAIECLSLFAICCPSIRILGSEITQHLLLFKLKYYEIGDFFNFSQ